MKIFDSSSAGQYNSIYHYTLGVLGIPSTDTTTLGTTEYVRLFNVWLRNTSERIWRVQNTWKFVDNNQTSMNQATTDLVANQQDYALETTTYDIEAVTALDSNGDSQRLEPITYQDKGYAEQEFLETAGMPKYYKLRGNVISLFPKPSAGDVTTTSGLTLFLHGDITPAITTSATTLAMEPGIPRQFHDLLGLGIAADKALSLGMNDKWQQLTVLLNNKNKELETHYSLRQSDVKQNIRPSTRSSL
jgi:hypothetical protein